MGSNRAKLITRCCHAAVSLVVLSVMFWLAWCLVGLTVVQVSEPQRRAVVHYSPTPSTSSTPATVETSAANAISKLPTTSSLELKGKDLAKGDFSPRDKSANNATADHGGDSKPPPRNPLIVPNKAPDDKLVFGTVLSQVDTKQDLVHARRVSIPGAENRPEDRNERRKTAESTTGGLHDDISPTRAYVETRTESRVSASRDATDLPKRDDIQSSRRSEDKFVPRDPEFDRDETRRRSSLPDRDRHRYDDDLRDERGSKGKYHSTDRGRESDDRYSKGDTRVYPDGDIDPPKEDEVRFSKGRYPDDRVRKGDDDDRYDTRRRYRDERPRPLELDKGLEGRLPTKDDRSEERSRNGDRYRDRDDDRKRDRVDDRYRDRVDDRYRDRVDDRYRHRDDDKYHDRVDDRYRDRDDDRYRDRDDDKYRDRDDDKYRARDDERHKYRDDDRYRRRDEEGYRSRGDEPYPVRGDDRYRLREEEKHRYRDDDRYIPPDDDDRRSRDDEEKRYRVRADDRDRDYDRYRNDKADPRDSPRRFDDDKEGYRSRTDDDKYVVTSLSVPRIADDRDSESRSSSNRPVGDRKPTSSRYEYSLRSEETVTDYDIPERESSRSREEIPRLPRPAYDDEEKYRERSRDDEDRRPYRYEKDRLQISPTRSRDESSHSRIESRLKGSNDDRKYLDNQRNKPRDDDRYDTDRKRIEDSRSSFSTDETSRRYIDDIDDRDKFLTKLPTGDSKDRKEEVVLDRRSYASDDEYRTNSRRSDDDRNRRRTDDTRRRYDDDESYSRRDELDDEEYKSRIPPDYDRDKSRRRDRYDDDSRRYDDRYDDRYSSRSDHSVSRPVRRYDTHLRDEDEMPRRDPDRTVRIEGSQYPEGYSRPSSSNRDEERSYSRDGYTDYKPSAHRRYDEVSSGYNNRDSYSESRRHPDRARRPTNTREPVLGSSMTSSYPKDTSDAEERFKRPDDRPQRSRAPNDEFSKEDSDRTRGQVRPLSAKDVIEAANRQSDTSDSNARKVFYPVFDPRLSNLTSPEIIRPGERRGTTITLRKRRSAGLHF